MGCDVLSLQEVAEVIGRVTYRPGWQFTVYQGRHEGPHLQIQAEVPDAVAAGEVTVLDVHCFLPPMRDEAAVLDWLLWRLTRIEVHECREFLRLDGRPWSDPHAESADRDL
jgi:hypothetical protein